MSTTLVPVIDQSAELRPFRQILAANIKSIQAVIPRNARHLDAARLSAIALTAIACKPILLKCDPISVAICVKESAGLGLQLDGVLGQAYLIPYKQKDGSYKCQMQVGYKGYITMASRNANLTYVMADVVYDCDKFDFAQGTRAYLKHRPADVRPHDAHMTHAYALIRFKSGQCDFRVMTAQEVTLIKNKSQAVRYEKKDSPWFTNEDEMWKKTAIRRLLKHAPMEESYSSVLVRDEMREMGIEDESEKLRELHEAKEIVINADERPAGGLYDLTDMPTANRIYNAFRKHNKKATDEQIEAACKLKLEMGKDDDPPLTWQDIAAECEALAKDAK